MLLPPSQAGSKGQTYSSPEALPGVRMQAKPHTVCFTNFLQRESQGEGTPCIQQMGRRVPENCSCVTVPGRDLLQSTGLPSGPVPPTFSLPSCHTRLRGQPVLSKKHRTTQLSRKHRGLCVATWCSLPVIAITFPRACPTNLQQSLVLARSWAVHKHLRALAAGSVPILGTEEKWIFPNNLYTCVPPK